MTYSSRRLPLPSEMNAMRFVLMLLCTVLISACQISPIEPPLLSEPMIKGYSYTSFWNNAFELGNSINALEELQTSNGTSTVALNIFIRQDTDTSTQIYRSEKTSTDADIQLAVARARKLGMEIMLKPNLDSKSGNWRAFITPDADGLWFQSYTAIMLEYATLCKNMEIEYFCIGTELVSATQSVFSSKWRELIRKIRRVYNGKILYCANWSGNHSVGLLNPEFSTVEFWDECDIIGISSYHPIAKHGDKATPSYQTAMRLIQDYSNALEQLSQRFNKPIILAECGTQPIRGALAEPYNFSLATNPTAQLDEDVQDMYVKVMIDAIGSKSWCKGIFWWNWESIRTSNEQLNYTTRNKKANLRISNWYRGLT
jgi:hypothetical protein